MEIVLGVIVAIALLVAVIVLKSKLDGAKALKEKGRALGEWTVYYDVPGRRIGLRASFGEDQLLRFLIFRLHDLFSYNAGLRAEQSALAEAVRAAARGEASWTLLFPPAAEDCFHATQPRFLGGDAIAKHKGLVGECVAIAGYLAARQPDPVVVAVDALVSRQLAEGDPPAGPRFWRRAVAALDPSTRG